MATYKGIGFDATSGKVRTATSSDSVQFNAQIDAQDGILATGGVSTDTISTTGDASVGGNLTVTGDIIGRSEVQLVVQDPMIDLGIGNSTTSAKAGGYSLTMNRNSGFTAETITACTAGNAGTPSAPQLTSSSASSFSAGDILCLTGSSDASNNGLYVVANVVSTTITLEGVGGTPISGALPFAQNQVGTTTGDSASAFKVDLYVQAVADGSSNFNDGAGSPFAKGTLLEKYQANATKGNFNVNGSYQPVGTSASGLSMQDVYDNGGAITTASSANIAFDLQSGDFTVDRGNMVLGGTNATNFTMDGGAFTVGATTPVSQGAIAGSTVILEGQATGTSGAIDLNIAQTSSSFTVSMNSTAVMEIKEDAVALFENFASQGVGSVERTATANGDDLLFDLKGNFEASLILQSAGNAVDAIKIQTVTNGGGIDINSAKGLAIDAVDTTTITMIANDASKKTLTISGANTGAGQGTVAIQSDDGLDFITNAQNRLEITNTTSTFSNKLIVNAGNGLQFSGESTLAQSFETDDTFGSASDAQIASALAIKTYVDNAIPVVDQDLAFAGDSGSSSVNLATQTLTINTGANLTTSASGQTLTIDLDGAVDLGTSLAIQSGQVVTAIDTDTTLGGGSASDSNLVTQLAVKTYVDEAVQLKQDYTELGDGSSGALSAGQVVAINGSGNAIQANASTASNARVIGICVSNISGTIYVQQVGNNKSVTGLTAGTTYYASTTGGALTATPPSSTGNVVFQVGYARSSTELIVAPNFIMEIG